MAAHLKQGKAMTRIHTLFLDIGGVLLTNGWDHHSREKAVVHFGLDGADFESKHKLYYDQHETGKLTLNEYLLHTIFYQKQNFSLDQFKSFMYAESQPHPEMLQLMHSLKKEFNLKIATVSNEGRELSEYRIKTFHLDSFVDAFFISCFLGYQKPDPRMYKTSLDIMQVDPKSVLYIDDRPHLVEAGAKCGLKSILHESMETTHQQIEALMSLSVN